MGNAPARFRPADRGGRKSPTSGSRSIALATYRILLCRWGLHIRCGLGTRFYVTGQQPIAGKQPVLSGGQLGNVASHEAEVIGVGDFSAQTEAVYKKLRQYP